MDTPPLTDSQAAAVAPSTGSKLVAIGCHLSLLLGLGLGTLIPFIVWLVNRRTGNLVENHSRSALNFHLSLIIYLLISWIAVFFTVGFSAFSGIASGVASHEFPLGAFGISALVVLCFIFAAAAVTLGALILAVIAAIRASDGEPYRYPFTLPIFS